MKITLILPKDLAAGLRRAATKTGLSQRDLANQAIRCALNS